jgi:hypothetical protein
MVRMGADPDVSDCGTYERNDPSLQAATTAVPASTTCRNRDPDVSMVVNETA